MGDALPANPLVSVIVPFYDVERYLRSCLCSIQQQSYRNLEVICVDDGSADGSKDIVRDFIEHDSRFTLVEKAHGGVSDSRNVGLDACSGDFILFVDSDDAVSGDIVRVLLEESLMSGSDVSMCGYQRFQADEDVPLRHSGEEASFQHFSGIDAYLRSYQGAYTQMNVIWGKLYRSSLFNDVRYPCGYIHEDEFITYKLIVSARKVSVTDSALVYYRKRPGSIMEQSLSEKNLVALDAFHQRLEYFIDMQSSELIPYAADYYLGYISWFYCDLKSHGLRKQLHDRYKHDFRLYKGYLSGANRGKRMLFMLCPSLFGKLYKMASSSES